MDFKNFIEIKKFRDKFLNMSIHKPSLRPIQPFWRLLDTNRQKNDKQSIYVANTANEIAPSGSGGIVAV